MTEVVCKRPLKERVKRYRSIIILAIGLLFNLLESLYFGAAQGLAFNLHPLTTGEFICDDISLLIMAFAVLMGMYDANKYAPQRIIALSRDDLNDLINDHAQEAMKEDK